MRPIERVLSPAFLKLNIVLAILASVVVASFVFLSNLVVFQKYSLNLRKQQLNQLIIKLPTGGSADSGYGMEGLLSFARASGMVEAKDAGVLLEEGGVAVSGTIPGQQNP